MLHKEFALLLLSSFNLFLSPSHFPPYLIPKAANPTTNGPTTTQQTEQHQEEEEEEEEERQVCMHELYIICFCMHYI